MLQALGSRATAPDAPRRRVWARSPASYGHSPPASKHIDGFFWASLPSSHPFQFSAFGLGSHTHHFHSALTYRQLEHDVRTRTRLVITIAIALESHNTSARLVYILSTPYLLCHHRCPSGLPPSTCSYCRLRPYSATPTSGALLRCTSRFTVYLRHVCLSCPRWMHHYLLCLSASERSGGGPKPVVLLASASAEALCCSQARVSAAKRDVCSSVNDEDTMYKVMQQGTELRTYSSLRNATSDVDVIPRPLAKVRNLPISRVHSSRSVRQR